jgi:hypothetical protein
MSTAVEATPLTELTYKELVVNLTDDSIAYDRLKELSRRLDELDRLFEQSYQVVKLADGLGVKDDVIAFAGDLINSYRTIVGHPPIKS